MLFNIQRHDKRHERQEKLEPAKNYLGHASFFEWTVIDR